MLTRSRSPSSPNPDRVEEYLDGDLKLADLAALLNLSRSIGCEPMDIN